MRKKRILACTESSMMGTGYGVYYREVLTRLHETDKYELCELATYATPEEVDPSIPWKFVPVMPSNHDEQEKKKYMADPANQWGQYRFEQTCLDFRPDIVFDIRDPWMSEHEQRSPFRRFYHWAIMPPIDGLSQDSQWLAQYANADAVFTYTDWGLDVLREEGNDQINLKCSAPPAADMNVFKPCSDKAAQKAAVGLDGDCLIVGTVMRNQKRKLYAELIEGFAKFLKTAPASIAKRTFLYLHCKWPDIGWDIPKLIKQAGISHRCIFTSVCNKCGSSFPTFFQGAKTFCRNCGEREAVIGDSHKGVSRENLANIMNLFDVYVQYSSHEGFGMPQVEAAACGVPVMAVDYSAMSDVLKKIDGTPIKVLVLNRDCDTHRLYAVPDNDDFAKSLAQKLSLPEAYRKREGVKARRLAEEYSYDTTAKVWEDHFDSVQVRDLASTWASSAEHFNPNPSIPNGLSNEQFVKWGLTNIAGQPELINSYMCVRMIRDLNEGLSMPHTGGSAFTEFSFFGQQNRREHYNRDRATNELLNLGRNKNIWEERRAKCI